MRSAMLGALFLVSFAALGCIVLVKVVARELERILAEQARS